ncbi:hypothetical protein C9I57_14705 [Trinickia symbiotica]|uniref:Uncharacterized protein n=2 Tax=Trinickia symbiotica TaxID=863227 RepID=A0A2T3XUV8_9BURK|nr:hypothetical protein C9I57_14705 [Trinickia symbiotica]
MSGAKGALSADLYNRQFHEDEKQRIHKLAGNDSVEEARLTAAACAMTHCYAEYPEGSVTYQQLKQIADFGASDALAGERDLLSQQTGMFGYTTSGIFSDANMDAAKLLNNTYQLTTRGAGAAEAALGALGIAGAFTSAPVSCATGVGCVANALVADTSADALIAGSKQVISGQPESTYLNQALIGLGMSSGAAGLLEAALGIGSAATAGGAINVITDQVAALNKLGAASYQQFVTSGIEATPEIMQSPQAQALAREILAGSPNLTDQQLKGLVAGYIESGSTLPSMGQAAPGTILIKVVPKGDGVNPVSGYWMSPQQAQAIATMTPEQVGQILGLPAAQAANILRNGMDFYAITPKAGSTPNVFVSNVAGTAQGSATMPGGAQQVIVPNRGQWTAPTKVNPFALH